MPSTGASRSPAAPQGAAPRPPLRVFIWTAEAARLAPDVAPAMDLLPNPEDAALLTVGRTEPAARLGRSWYALVPGSLEEFRDTFTPPIDARDRAWLLDTLERQVRECFWETAYDIFRREESPYPRRTSTV